MRSRGPARRCLRDDEDNNPGDGDQRIGHYSATGFLRLRWLDSISPCLPVLPYLSLLLAPDAQESDFMRLGVDSGVLAAAESAFVAAQHNV